MKFKCDADSIQYKVMGLSEDAIKKRVSMAKNIIKDRKKQRDAKNNWRRNKHKIKAGMKKWHKSTKGKRFHRSLGRFNALREESTSDIKLSQKMVIDALLSLSSIETHMLLELKYYEPDFNALSEFLLIVEIFHEEANSIKADLIDAYTTGVINNTSYENLIETIQMFLDPKVYFLEKRKENGFSNDILEDGDTQLIELNNLIENTKLTTELYNEIDNLFIKGNKSL